jgi:hypothetical protein
MESMDSLIEEIDRCSAKIRQLKAKRNELVATGIICECCKLKIEIDAEVDKLLKLKQLSEPKH